MFSSGWTLDEVLDLTWEQLSVCIHCVVSVKSEQMSTIMDAVSMALGGKPSKKTKKKTQPRSQKNQTKAKKEESMLKKLSAMGITPQVRSGQSEDK